MLLNDEQKVLADAALANKLNVIHHVYVDISGDLVAGALLGQILYWFAPDKNGNIRAKIEKDGHTWIAKTRSDWFDEIRISPKQYDRAIKILKTKNFVDVATFKFNGNPTTHIRIKPKAINEAVEAWKIEQVKWLFPDGEKPENVDVVGSLPLGNNDINQRETSGFTDEETRYSPLGNNDINLSGISSYTENTSENVAENTHRKPKEGVPVSLLKHKETMSMIDEDFETVWKEYPKKEGKQKARKAFERAVRGMGTRKKDGQAFTAEEILAEVVLYRQHVERLIQDGELTYRYIPSGGSWFEGEGWLNDYPSISSSFDDLMQGIEYNRTASQIRQTASKIAKAKDEMQRYNMKLQLNQLIQALPY